MSNYLPAMRETGDMLANFRAASSTIGSGGSGETYLRVNKQTGELTFGPDNTPLPEDARFVIGLHDFTHGYMVWDAAANKVTSRTMVPIMTQSVAPVPPNGKYGTYEDGGPRPTIELVLSSLDERGQRLVFTSWSVSNDNRIRNLIDHVALHLGMPDGEEAGYIHPVVKVKSGSYQHAKYGKIYHIDFEILDWLHKDGESFLSDRELLETKPGDGPNPWDDDDDVSEEELEMVAGGR